VSRSFSREFIESAKVVSRIAADSRNIEGGPDPGPVKPNFLQRFKKGPEHRTAAAKGLNVMLPCQVVHPTHPPVNWKTAKQAWALPASRERP